MPTQKQNQKDVITRLTASGEEAFQKLVDLPAGARVMEAANAIRDRVDELTRRMRSLDPLEKRVAELERRLEELAPKPKPAAKKPPAKKPPAKKPAASRSKKTS